MNIVYICYDPNHNNEVELNTYTLANINTIIFNKILLNRVLPKIKDGNKYLKEHEDHYEINFNKKIYKISIKSNYGQLQYSLTEDIIKRIDLLKYVLEYNDQKEYVLNIPDSKYFSIINRLNKLINIHYNDDNYAGINEFIEPYLLESNYKQIIDYLRVSDIKYEDLSQLKDEDLKSLFLYFDYEIVLKYLQINPKFILSKFSYLSSSNQDEIFLDFYNILSIKDSYKEFNKKNSSKDIILIKQIEKYFKYSTISIVTKYDNNSIFLITPKFTIRITADNTLEISNETNTLKIDDVRVEYLCGCICNSLLFIRNGQNIILIVIDSNLDKYTILKEFEYLDNIIHILKFDNFYQDIAGNFCYVPNTKQLRNHTKYFNIKHEIMYEYTNNYLLQAKN